MSQTGAGVAPNRIVRLWAKADAGWTTTAEGVTGPLIDFVSKARASASLAGRVRLVILVTELSQLLNLLRIICSDLVSGNRLFAADGAAWIGRGLLVHTSTCKPW